MKIIFCSDALYPDRVDMSYTDEAEAAQAAGLEYELFNFERLTREGDATGAVRRVQGTETPGTAVYRGWMLRAEAYGQLYQALADRGVHLINSPEQYRHCHHLPASYDRIASHTPRSTWLPFSQSLNIDLVMEKLAPLGEGPVIVKDYVKSRKHEWAEACFIPSASDRAAVERVSRRFVELQGDQLTGGLVFREFRPLQQIGVHSRSGMPLTREYRLFFLNGALLQASQYWAEGDYGGPPPPVDDFAKIAAKIDSHFFTMDIAQEVDGTWIIVELGDGQVAGLPDDLDAKAFYRSLAESPKEPRA